MVEVVEEYICPRAQYDFDGPSAYFKVSGDPAVLEIARRVVAGVYGPLTLHPRYEAYIEAWGEKRAAEMIRNVVTMPDACDVIQTDMELGGMGLFGSLTKEGYRKGRSRFDFYEWLGVEEGQLFTSMTARQARDIVEGKRTRIKFSKRRP